jgi:hypothetical protein
LINSSLFPSSLAINPTSNAAMIVPSRTPFNFPENTKERTPAMIAIDESKTIFVVPKLVFHVCTIARTKDSPGSMTTSASTSR